MTAAAVCVLGLGPAGRALTHQLTRRDVNVIAVDPSPERRWRATYAAWADELPTGSGPDVVAARFSVGVFGDREHHPDRTYTVLDTAALQHALTVDAARVVVDRAAEVTPHRVRLAGGDEIAADLVVDARGTRLDPGLTQQTAVGVILDRATADDRLGGCWLMDWRGDHGAGDGAPPSFLYAVALDDDRMLLEETCLVGRPALGLNELRRRLETRLAGHGLRLSGREPTEHVRFATEPDARQRIRGVPAIGARGGIMHPATGYSVAPALTLAPRLAEAVMAGDDLRRILWPTAARLTGRLRHAGLRTLLGLDAAGTRAFFDAFFSLPIDRQRSYLSGRTDAGGTLAAMATMAVHLPPSLVGVAVRSTVGELVGR